MFYTSLLNKFIVVLNKDNIVMHFGQIVSVHSIGEEADLVFDSLDEKKRLQSLVQSKATKLELTIYIYDTEERMKEIVSMFKENKS